MVSFLVAAVNLIDEQDAAHAPWRSWIKVEVALDWNFGDQQAAQQHQKYSKRLWLLRSDGKPSKYILPILSTDVRNKLVRRTGKMTVA